MKLENVKTITIVGADSRGAQMSQVFALHGYRTYLTDSREEELKRAIDEITNGPFGLMKGVKRGKLTEAQMKDALSRLTVTSNIEEAGRNADYVVEAVAEDATMKEKTMRKLDEICPSHAILSSDTSMVLVTDLGAVTKRPEKVIGMHFSQPVVVMKMLEVIPGLLTSPETISVSRNLGLNVGKSPIVLKKDTPSFVANRLLQVVINESIRFVEEGIATVEDIDNICKMGFNWPMGPFEVADLAGLDLWLSTMEYVYTRLGDARYKPPVLLAKMVKSGMLGRKSNKGFYDYTKPTQSGVGV